MGTVGFCTFGVWLWLCRCVRHSCVDSWVGELHTWRWFLPINTGGYKLQLHRESVPQCLVMRSRVNHRECLSEYFVVLVVLIFASLSSKPYNGRCQHCLEMEIHHPCVVLHLITGTKPACFWVTPLFTPPSPHTWKKWLTTFVTPCSPVLGTPALSISIL